MRNLSSCMLSFILDNQTDHIHLLQIAEGGSLKRMHTRLKVEIHLNIQDEVKSSVINIYNTI